MFTCTPKVHNQIPSDIRKILVYITDILRISSGKKDFEDITSSFMFKKKNEKQTICLNIILNETKAHCLCLKTKTKNLIIAI